MQENINDISQVNDNIKVKPKIINKPSKCDVCGANITWFNRARHLKTQKHNDAILCKPC
jgi:formylmethanofuran dehydrogenase subunit E